MTISDSSDSQVKRRGRKRVRKDISPVQTLDRSLNVLESLALNQPSSLSDISRLAKLHTSTTARILETFRQRSYVEYDDHSGLYRMGVKSLEVGNTFLVDRPLNELAHESMLELSNQLRESVNLAVRDGDKVIYVKQIQNESHAIRMFTRVGARVPIYCTGNGKALLGYESETRIREILSETDFKPFTNRTVANADEFIERAKEAASRGFAWDNEEREIGVRCIAAPIFGPQGDVIAALSVSAPTMRLTLAQGKANAPELIQAAQKISKRLGYTA